MIRFISFTDDETGVITRKVEINSLKVMAISTFIARTTPNEVFSMLQFFDIENELKSGSAQWLEGVLRMLFADIAIKTSKVIVKQGETDLSGQTLESDTEYLRIDNITIQNVSDTIKSMIQKKVEKELGISNED